MRKYIKRIALIFGVIAFISPILMIVLWNSYIDEQSQLTQEKETSRQKCEPYDLEVNRLNNRLNMNWKTDTECSGFILLAATYTDFSNLPYKVMSSNGERPGLDHKIQLLKQDELEYRYAIIVSEGEWYGIRGEPFFIKE